MKQINNIYYIIHPAFAVGLTHSPQNNLTEAEAEKYISQVLIPIVKQAQRDPNAFVVFLKSPHSEITSAKDQVTLRIENKLESQIKRMLQKRSFSIDTPSVLHNTEPKKTITKEVLAKLKEFNVPKQVEIHAYGSFRDMCVNAFSKHLAQNLSPQARLKIVEAGTIPFKGERFNERMRKLLLKDKKRRAIIASLKRKGPVSMKAKLRKRLLH